MNTRRPFVLLAAHLIKAAAARKEAGEWGWAQINASYSYLGWPWARPHNPFDGRSKHEADKALAVQRQLNIGR